jgi:hypothetical protein
MLSGTSGCDLVGTGLGNFEICQFNSKKGLVNAKFVYRAVTTGVAFEMHPL